MKLKKGDLAPQFNLSDQHNKEFKLGKFKGKKILLSFHPLAWTSVCKKQMRSMEENYHTFTEFNTIPVGISVDSVPCKYAWAKSIGLKHLKILSDFWPHGEVAKSYDIFRKVEGFSERANILVSESGVVGFIKIYNLPELPNIKEILEFLAQRG